MADARPRRRIHEDLPGHLILTRRICVVGSGWDFTSGVSYYTCRLSAALVRQNRVSAILMRKLIPTRLYPGRDHVGKLGHRLDYPEQVSVFNGVDWYWLPSMARAARFLRREKPDVVVFQWWTGAVLHSYLLLARIARRRGAKIVVEFHETQDTGEARVKGAAGYLSLLGRRFLIAADGFVTHSEYDRQIVTQMFGLHDRPMAVIPVGPFDHHKVDAADADADAAASMEVRDEVTRILFFGTIRPYKGLEHLIEAFNALTPEQVAGFRLAVVGETWEGWTVPLDLIAKSPYRDRIDLVNRYVEDREVGNFFEAADAVALPYTRSSASGPLHIAMAHGLPVILSDVGGLREGADGYDGILWVPPSSPDSLREALLGVGALRGQQFADPRSWDETAKSFDGLLSEILVDR